MNYKTFHSLIFTALISMTVHGQQKATAEQTEYYSPVPKVITPGSANFGAPSDAIILFDGKNLDEWEPTKRSAANEKWTLVDGTMLVNKKVGDFQTKRKFNDFQLHIEYRIPADITGSGQSRGNSGIFMAALPWGAGGYELQVLDNYNNSTYVNGQAGSIYKQNPPMVNACLPPGEWQRYEVVWIAPRFKEDGTIASSARVTVFHNGVLVQHNLVLTGDTPYVGNPEYKKHGPSPIKLQAHGDKSEPISYRNIWLREL